MNIIKFLRKPYLAIILSLLFLFTSCSQYDSDVSNQSFDEKANSFFNSNLDLINITTLGLKQKNLNTTKNISLEILNNLNNELGTNISYPDLALDLIDYDREKILNLSLNEGWINQKDIDLNNTFLADLTNNNFDTALANFKNKVLELNLPNEEFEKQNLFVNIIKSFNDIDPNLFKTETNKNYQARGGWACAGAVFALAAATAGLGSCATIVACGGAIILHLVAIDSVARKCKDYL